MTALPLSGLHVLELAHLIAGPVCGLYLADMGADVVKVESPDGGDAARRTYRAPRGADSPVFVAVNRNKRSLALNLSTPEGHGAFLRLAARADVIIEAYRGGVAERLRIGYDDLAPLNPGLVYCSLSAFGPHGPWREKPGLDMLVQAMGGLMAMTGDPKGGPALVPTPVVDTIGALLAGQGILTALLHRKETGEGQRVDVSLLNGMLLAHAARLPLYWSSGEEPRRLGSAHPHLAPFQAFLASDGWIYVAVWVDRLWKPFCLALDLPALAEDPRFLARDDRVAARDTLTAILEPVFRRRTVKEWMARLETHDVLCAPVNAYGDLEADPQILATGMIVEQDHPVAGRIRTLDTPIRFGKTPGSIRSPAPALGQHTDEVLGEAGFSREDIERLREVRAIG